MGEGPASSFRCDAPPAIKASAPSAPPPGAPISRLAFRSHCAQRPAEPRAVTLSSNSAGRPTLRFQGQVFLSTLLPPLPFVVIRQSAATKALSSPPAATCYPERSEGSALDFSPLRRSPIVSTAICLVGRGFSHDKKSGAKRLPLAVLFPQPFLCLLPARSQRQRRGCSLACVFGSHARGAQRRSIPLRFCSSQGTRSLVGRGFKP